MGSRILIHNLGYPRMGALRQLKKSLEAYWRGTEPRPICKNRRRLAPRTLAAAKGGRHRSDSVQRFQLLRPRSRHAAMVGAVPERFGWKGKHRSADLLCDGAAAGPPAGKSRATIAGATHAGVHAMEMTKWFDTNYHYIVPNFTRAKIRLRFAKAIDEFQEALALGIKTKPVLLGPFTFLKLGKIHGKDLDRYELLPG